MDYFYSEPGNIGNRSLVIVGGEFTHLTHVLRKKEGDLITVVDGLGTAYEVCIGVVEKKSVTCRIISRHDGFHEPRLMVTLAAAVLKNPSRYDFLVEKATELGVKEVIPIATDRTITSRAKSARWRKLALAAMKQSGRSHLPHVRELTPLSDIITEAGGDRALYDRMIVAHEKAPGGGSGSGAGMVRPSDGGKVLLLVGPEGGFTGGEIKRCVGSGFETLYMGERRLRAETAAIVGLTLLMR